tara:strand:- start:30505 stop:31275 length:771 start_codon:yes stop_codon:yes gene_type:complete
MNGCKKPKDVHCDMATLNIYNNSKTQAVVFHWNTAQNWDTIMPGETTSATMENLKMEYAIDGSITSKSTEIVYFETNSATYAYEFSLCDETINAPGGFVDLSEDCANGEYNPESGELDVDCGGFCVPCSEPQFTCTTPADEVNWDIFGLPDATVTSTNINYAFGVSITFNFSNARLVAIIHSPTLPTETKRFDIGALDNQMQIYYHVGFASYSPDPNQHVYIVKDANGDFYLKYCDLQFSEGNISFLGSANIPLIK